MNCSYCKGPMEERHGKLSYTILDKMISVHIHNCSYDYCDRCDIVTLPSRVEQQLKDEIHQSQPSSAITINL